MVIQKKTVESELKMDEPRVIFIDIPTMNKPRSVSPISPSIDREKNTGFFDMLSRRFGRRSHDELYFSQNGEEDTRSSSTESCSSTSVQLAARNDGLTKSHNQTNTSSNKQRQYEQNCACEFGQSYESTSDSSSDSVEHATSNGLHAHRRSTSSLRNAMQNLTISTRSLSCGSTGKDQKIKKPKKTPPQPKCILRQPISYTYLKGMSGLPTQRVPKSSVCCQHPMYR